MTRSVAWTRQGRETAWSGRNARYPQHATTTMIILNPSEVSVGSGTDVQRLSDQEPCYEATADMHWMYYLQTGQVTAFL